MATATSTESKAEKDQEEAVIAKTAADEAAEQERYAEEQRQLAAKAAGKKDNLKRGDGIVAIQDPSQPMANPPKAAEVHGEAQTAFSE